MKEMNSLIAHRNEIEKNVVSNTRVKHSSFLLQE